MLSDGRGGLTGRFAEINMGLPMTISVQDVDRARSYSNNDTENVQRPQENREMGEDIEVVPMGSSSTEDDNDDIEVEGSQLEPNIDEEGQNQTPLPATVNGLHASVTGSFHGHHFRVQQLRGEQPPVVPTAFLPQLAPVRNGQLYQFSSKYGLRMWALVNIQHRPGMVPTRASVEREFWRQAHWAGRRRDRRRMLSDLDHHVQHDNLGQRSLRKTSTTPTPWNIASGDPTFGQIHSPGRYNSDGFSSVF